MQKFHLFQFLNWTYAGELSHLSFLLILQELQPVEIQSLSCFPDYVVSLWHPREHQRDFSGRSLSSSCGRASQMLRGAKGRALSTACSTSSCTDLWGIINPVQIGVMTIWSDGKERDIIIQTYFFKNSSKTLSALYRKGR